MGAKDEEIILIHATVHYNERWSSVETHFFCFYTTLPPPSLCSPVSHPPVLPVLPARFIPTRGRSEDRGKDERDRARGPLQMLQMIALFSIKRCN